VRSVGSSLAFGLFGREGRIELLNHAAQPTQARIESLVVAGALPLAYANQDLAQLRTTYPPLPERLLLPEIEPGTSRWLRITPRRDAMTRQQQSALLRVSSGTGVVFWLPVTAERDLD
jgi:hypothetical protein